MPNRGAQIVDYVYMGGRLLGEGPGTTISGNGLFTYELSDKLSERVSLDKYGSFLGRQAHLPFGEETGENGTQEKHHFTNYESDSESGTDYAVNRQDSQALGRFMQADPVGGSATDPQSLNRYSYAVGDPVNAYDPLGLDGIVLLPGGGSLVQYCSMGETPQCTYTL
jgi:RHS repeat-associated protein